MTTPKETHTMKQITRIQDNKTPEVQTTQTDRPSVDWQSWMSCLPQSRIDKIAFKTGFKTSDGMLHPKHSSTFNNAVNVARAKRLGLI